MTNRGSAGIDLEPALLVRRRRITILRVIDGGVEDGKSRLIDNHAGDMMCLRPQEIPGRLRVEDRQT